MPRMIDFGFLLVCALCQPAHALIELNTATEAELDGLKGLGPATTRRILAERQAGGRFQDWPDFSRRVKGMGSTTTQRLSQDGLVIEGQPAPAPSPSSSSSSSAATPTSATATQQ